MGYAVTNPATGETVKTYDTLTDAELDAAITAADEAHRTWSKETTVEERAALIRRVSELHNERRQELAELIVREMGKPVEQALGEVDFSAEIYRYYASNGEAFLADEPIELMGSEGSAFMRTSSLGVLIGIMPWNFPYYQVARFAGPNLVLGNTILLKHASQCPESSAAIEQIFTDAGFPDGAYRNLYASNAQVADIIADPRVCGVSLTGSEAAGAAVAEIAGRNLKKVVLELGGSDPFILLSTDNLDEAVEAAIAGPLSSLGAAENLEAQLQRAEAQGATVVARGHRDGAFFSPSVITGVTPDNAAYREEFFGPVASVYRVQDEDEALQVANDIPFGLGSYLFTTDPAQALRVADRIEAGMVFVNGTGLDSAELPFGGVKRSGFGRELGRFGIAEFANKKLIRILK